MNPLPADRARWWNDEAQKHFRKHRRELGLRSVADYDLSARDTIRLGTEFTYIDPDHGMSRVGYYNVSNGRFTAMNRGRTRILTHFVPRDGEDYVYRLPRSTYSRR